RTAFEQMFADISPRPKASIETRSIEFQRGILSTSDRVSIVTRQETILEERMGALAALPFTPPVSRNADGIATRANCKPSTVQPACLDTVRRNARENLPTSQSALKLPGARHAPVPNWPGLPVTQPARRGRPLGSAAQRS